MIVHHSLEYPDQYWGHVSQEAREFVQLMTQCNPRKR